MRIQLFHTFLGTGVLTDESGSVVFIDADGVSHTTARGGYFHTANDGPREAQYTPEELHWIDNLVVAWETMPMPQGWSHYRDGMWCFAAGASLKTREQLRRIEEVLGHRMFLA